MDAISPQLLTKKRKVTIALITSASLLTASVITQAIALAVTGNGGIVYNISMLTTMVLALLTTSLTIWRNIIVSREKIANPTASQYTAPQKSAPPKLNNRVFIGPIAAPIILGIFAYLVSLALSTGSRYAGLDVLMYIFLTMTALMLLGIMSLVLGYHSAKHKKAALILNILTIISGVTLPFLIAYLISKSTNI